MKELLERDDKENRDAAILNAAHQWVRSFDGIPTSVIEKLYKSGDTIHEVTPTGKNYDTVLPLWGRMWSFNDNADNLWFEDKDNLKAMADCGFRIFEQEDFGYIFGIDGVGHDFYEKLDL